MLINDQTGDGEFLHHNIK